jgi:hypothetical protein
MRTNVQKSNVVHEYIKKIVEVLIKDVGAATTDRDLHNTCITGAVEFQNAGVVGWRGERNGAGWLGRQWSRRHSAPSNDVGAKFTKWNHRFVNGNDGFFFYLIRASINIRFMSQ